MMVEPQDESQRFLCELSRIRGFAWTDELPIQQQTQPTELTGYTSIDLYESFSEKPQASLRIPIADECQTPIERALQRSEDAGFSHDENFERLKALEFLRAYTVRLILGNPTIREELRIRHHLNGWPTESVVFEMLTAPILSGYFDPRTSLSQGNRIHQRLRDAEISSIMSSKLIQTTRTLTHARKTSDPRWQTTFNQIIAKIDQRQNELVRGNLRLVMAFSKQPARRINRAAAIRAGTYGLITAIARYETHHNATLATYAIYWIKQHSQRASQNHKSPLRVPVHRLDDINTLWHLVYNLWAQKRRAPDLQDLLANTTFSQKEVRTILKLSSHPRPLENMTSQHGMSIGDQLYEHDRPSPFLIFQSPTVPGLLPHLLRQLETATPPPTTDKRHDSKIIWQRYGVGIPKDLTLEEIGGQHDVTRERIRQIQAKEQKTIKRLVQLGRVQIPAILAPYYFGSLTDKP